MPVVDGHSITVTHPDKILFPDDGITKGELVDYYQRIAGRMLPQVRDRPLHMNRFPDGIHGIAIQQKRIPDSFPQWIQRVTVGKQGGTVTHALINDTATLVYLANYNMVTAHVWLSRTEAVDHPDLLIFDLDPADEDFGLVRRTALKVKAMLADYQLVAFVKTTGSRGLHVVVPIEPSETFEESHLFADFLAQRLATDDPDHLTTEFIKEQRFSSMSIATPTRKRWSRRMPSARRRAPRSRCRSTGRWSSPLSSARTASRYEVCRIG